MGSLLLGVTLLLFGLSLAGIVTISNTLLGILFIICGILYLIGGLGYSVPAVPLHRRTE